MNNMNLKDTIYYLFNRSYDEWAELPDETTDEMVDLFNRTVSEYGWTLVYEEICNFLYNECKDGVSVCNFSHFYWNYGACNYPIDNAYEFLGYLYYRMELQPDKFDAVDLMDSITSEILEKLTGDKSHNLHWNTEYIPEKDPVIIASVENWKKKNA